MDALSRQAAEISRALLAELCLALFLRKESLKSVLYLIGKVALSAPTGPALELFVAIDSTSSELQKTDLNTWKT